MRLTRFEVLKTYRYLGTGNPVTWHVSQQVLFSTTKISFQPVNFPRSPSFFGDTLFVGSVSHLKKDYTENELFSSHENVGIIEF